MNAPTDKTKVCVDNRKNSGGTYDFQVFNPNNGTSQSFTSGKLDKTNNVIPAEFRGRRIQRIGLNAGESRLISHNKI